MGKPFDVSKFRKEITKSIDGLSIGFNDPTDWISTGNYALNYLISGDFNRGIPLGKVTVFAGDSGAGKSYSRIDQTTTLGLQVRFVDTQSGESQGSVNSSVLTSSINVLTFFNVSTSKINMLKDVIASGEDISGVTFTRDYYTSSYSNGELERK